MKKNYLSTLLIVASLTIISSVGTAQEPELIARTVLDEKGYGHTELIGNSYALVSPGSKLKVVFKSQYACVANVGVRVFRKSVQTNIIDEVGKGEVLDFVSKLMKSREFTVEEGYEYAIAFQGMAVGVPVLLGAQNFQKQPFMISVKLEDQDGRTIQDFGDVNIQYITKVQKQIPGLNAYEIVDSVVYPTTTDLNGALFVKTSGASK